MIGSDLGHYRILEKIGEGGMGAVYKARDTHLDRFVAVKVLPEARASDAERRRRFIQEAKAASALNHPNIITVHDAANAEGLYYIVMEYVAGKTVDELIRRKPLRLNEALGYAIQIADALARAHVAGIVHRDLKPSNIMVDEHGQVKVLDFGLAKLTEKEGGAEEETATVESLTDAGTVVGTAAYMSPEQAEGRKVDARTDVFSFGLVLYEMLTGVNPFRRESRISTLSAILNEDPRPISGHSATPPSELDRAVMRCLRKEPQRRWQSMSDLKSLLEDMKEDSESGKSAVAEISRSRSRHWAVWVAAAVVVLAAAGTLTLWLLSGRTTKREFPVARLTFDTGVTWRPTVSADGKLIAYTSTRSGEGKPDIWIRRLDRPEPIRRTNDAVGASQSSLSPDGSRIAYRSERDGSIYVIDTLGGEEKKLAEEGCYPRFSPDGKSIVFMRLGATGLSQHNRMYVVPAQGGEERPIQPDYGAVVGRTGLGPVWSPDNKFLLFSGVRKGASAARWMVAPVAGGSAIPADVANTLPGMPTLPFPCAWLSPGSVLTSVGATIEGLNLYRVKILPDTFQGTGRAEQLTSGPGLKFNVAASAEGTVVFDNITWSTYLASLALDSSTHKPIGDPERVTSDTATKLNASASRNGAKVAWVSVAGFATGLRIEVRVRDLASGRDSVLSESGSPIDKYPRMSHDGALVAFLEQTPEGLAAMVAPGDGGTPRRVGLNYRIADFFPGNQDALIVQGSRRVARQSLSGGAPVLLVETTSGAIWDPRLSNDGKRIVFTILRNDGSVALCLVPVRDQAVPESDWIAVVESRKGWLGEPNWSPDDEAIYYCCEETGLTCIRGRALDRKTGRPVGEPFVVFKPHGVGSGLAGQRTSSGFSVARDRLYFIMANADSNIWMLRLPPE